MTLILSLLFACGPKQNTGIVAASQVTAPAVDSGEIPQWVLMPPVGKGEICATGAYKMKGNISMAQQQSAQRARGALARQISVQAKTLVKSYMEEGETGGESFTEELATSVEKYVTDMTLSGTDVRRVEAIKGNMYSMVCLDTEKYAAAFDNMSQLDEKARVQLRQRAKVGFDELDAETTKLREDQAAKMQSTAQ